MTPRQAPGDEYANPMGNCPTRAAPRDLEPARCVVIERALCTLNEAEIPVLLAGALAKHAYTGAWRDTKDLDLFLRPADVAGALETLAAAGFETELRDPDWLAKAWIEPHLVDLIFGLGNREIHFDDGWIERARPYEICGVETRLISLEDLIVSKVFIAKRDRFDGADIAHLVRCQGPAIDWALILDQMRNHGELLLWHLILVDYVYPDGSAVLPRALMNELFESVRARWNGGVGSSSARFRGSLLDSEAFAVDIRDWGYPDPRKES